LLKKSYFVLITFHLKVILSVIIVNYNVKYFLEQCLCSVTKAIRTSHQLADETEIFVVDNNSSDGSVEYLQPSFPKVQFIINKQNTGFAKASNQALSATTGKYILFLNPDTIIAEDSLSTCIATLESSDNIGAAGVRMINGNGQFLKESKRGFPFPWAAFCRLSGLSSLFPHSKLFASYYLGHLDEFKNSPVDVLSGAFMMIKKTALNKTGSFDEQFFMYAEDIDLSFRLQHMGYANLYIADTTIIHFKGESTKKNAGQIKLFYQAMDQFLRKHFSSSGLLFYFIQFGVWCRSKLALVENLFHTKKNKPGLAFILGDEVGANRIKEALLAAGKTIVQEQEAADEIVFCEGNNFSFKEIINLIQEKRPSLYFKFHAENSHSIVGSQSKDTAGETMSIS
jgi:N-acetylglucosaminyl-diphospho-decaprenol L-rhamnosyltransferase